MAGWIATGVVAVSAVLCLAGGVMLAEGALRVPRRLVLPVPRGGLIAAREIRAQGRATQSLDRLPESAEGELRHGIARDR
ncbi:MAG TPA: hypothetical protein VEV17_18680 [Bryobacteraceae bacterium]|nr:hypothetical protein [Bryobacteraceae bacterium]